MKVTHRQTKTSIGLESTRGSKHDNTRRFQGVFFRENKFAVVVSAFVGRASVPFNDVVPFEDIFFVWHGHDAGGMEGIFLEGL